MPADTWPVELVCLLQLTVSCVAQVLGIELNETYWNERCVGRSPRDIMTSHLPEGRLEPGQTVDDLLRIRGELFEQHIAAGLLEPTGGAAELVDAFSP